MNGKCQYCPNEHAPDVMCHQKRLSTVRQDWEEAFVKLVHYYDDEGNSYHFFCDEIPFGKQEREKIKDFIKDVEQKAVERGQQSVTSGEYVCPRHWTALRCRSCQNELEQKRD